eukprot:TRINITY_DN35736_c0_g1_i1.p1 TRINITY_DN35736_c0_g1~~TRINITY_DN35736_c0_g1_i1.p1  ORF type:complete len:194 (+),score=21.05 TRINITY_DN35736_c0_g1_i1:59-640(+)
MTKYLYDNKGVHVISPEGGSKILTKKDIENMRSDLDKGIQYYNQLTTESEEQMNISLKRVTTAKRRWMAEMVCAGGVFAYAGLSFSGKPSPERTIFNLSWMRGNKPEIKLTTQLRPIFRSDFMLRAFSTHCFFSTILASTILYGAYVRNLKYNYLLKSSESDTEDHQTYTLEKNVLIDLLHNINDALSKPPYK